MRAFYLDTETNNWILVHDNGAIEKLIAGNCSMYLSSDKLSVWIKEKNIGKGNALISALEKNAAGDKYANYAEFNTATADFFVKAPASGGGGGSDTGISPVLATDGVDDGNGTITGTTRFFLPIDVDMAKEIWAYESGILNMDFTKNIALKAIDFTTAPLSGNGILIFYHKK